MGSLICSRCSKRFEENDAVYWLTVKPTIGGMTSMVSEYPLCDTCFRKMLRENIFPQAEPEVNGEPREEKFVSNEDDRGFTVILGKSDGREVCIDFSNFNSALIAGDEGCGKTAFLEKILQQCDAKGAKTELINPETHSRRQAAHILDEVCTEVERRQIFESAGIEENDPVFIGIDQLEDYVVNGEELDSDFYRKILYIAGARPKYNVHLLITSEDSVLIHMLSGLGLCTWLRFCGHTDCSGTFLRGDERANDLPPRVFVSTISGLGEIDING